MSEALSFRDKFCIALKAVPRGTNNAERWKAKVKRGTRKGLCVTSHYEYISAVE